MAKKVVLPRLMYWLYALFALSQLNKALELHFKNPFRKWSSKTYIYKLKTFENSSKDYDKKVSY